MGCCSSRGALLSPVSEEERAIVSSEVNLGFQRLQVANISATIIALSERGTISQNAFNVMIVEMALNRTDMDNNTSAVSLMYQALKDEAGKFDGLKLAVLGVLLGRGTAGEKAEAYFAAVQEKEEDALNQTHVRLLFDALFTVAGEILPILVQENENEGISKPLFADYLTRLKSGKPNLVTRCTNVLMQSKSKVTKQDMKAAFLQEENLRDLISPYAVRIALRKEAETIASVPINSGTGLSISSTGLIPVPK